MSISGLTNYGSQQALQAILISGTARYVGLLTTLPSDRTGTGLVEASGSGYARLSHAAWVNGTDGTDTTRANSGAITLAALTGDVSGVVGWGVWDALTVGNLLAWGPMTDALGAETTVDFVSGDQPQFADQELVVKIGAE